MWNKWNASKFQKNYETVTIPQKIIPKNASKSSSKNNL